MKTLAIFTNVTLSEVCCNIIRADVPALISSGQKSMGALAAAATAGNYCLNSRLRHTNGRRLFPSNGI